MTRQLQNPLSARAAEEQPKQPLDTLGIASQARNEKPTVYLADWMPTHTEYGVAVMVARGDLQGDEAAKNREHENALVICKRRV